MVEVSRYLNNEAAWAQVGLFHPGGKNALFLQPSTADWLLCNHAPAGLTLKSLALCTQCIYVFVMVYTITYLLTYLLTYSISTALLEKLTGSQLFKKFPTFYGTQMFFTTFTRACHLSLSYVIPKYQFRSKDFCANIL